ncbi:MAG: alpha/beta hydrolase [Rhodospirillales bacterium]|nr:alpha/beta hydrolase [Rhodospirillales bacterium]
MSSSVVTFTNIITIVFIIYIGLVAAIYFGQRSLIYYPDNNLGTPAQYGMPEMQVLGKSWYAPAQDETLPVIVFFHGNAGHIGHRGFKARMFLDQGYGVLLVGYRGYGGNSGSPSEKGLYEDARTALSDLSSKSIAKEQVVLYGESIGTGIAVQMALEGHGRALVLEAPYSSLEDIASQYYPIFPVSWLLKDRFDSIDKVDKISIPKLIVHGKKDEVIPQELGRRLFEKSAKPKQWNSFAKAGHNNLFEHGAGVAVLEFLKEMKGKQ